MNSGRKRFTLPECAGSDAGGAGASKASKYAAVACALSASIVRSCNRDAAVMTTSKGWVIKGAIKASGVQMTWAVILRLSFRAKLLRRPDASDAT